MRSSKAGYI